jgi:hypothetical protein
LDFLQIGVFRGGSDHQRRGMMSAQRSGKGAGIGVGGVLVIAGIVVAIFWSLIIGIIIALIGLIAFGGFVRGKWY